MDYLNRALELAVDNVREGGEPFGAVLVRGDEVLAEGVNKLHQRYDVSVHAELEAIRKAQNSLETMDLRDCVMYASGEPCPMCLTAMYFSGIKKVYYAQTIHDAEEAGLGLSKHVYMELSKQKEQREMDMIHVTVDDKNLDALTHYKG
ncbi:nucleoside deaminase [Pontibacillus sp. HMF3514]|uniref:nucleoside deaminase n=1 Tax=Pontibacillus sp. HMF3514 TaxID=2692425 RepID=UPI0013203E10|nr:nucleoside deaminase [Pontibacillus sp. HMF3514]QHE51030.1 nucleoside deaminase [Pontibacillus sp. HMF3514]